MANLDDRTSSVGALVALQTRTYAAGLAAMADPASDELSSDYRRLGLDLLEAHNRSWPQDFDVSGYALPLVQHLSVHADWVEAAGDRAGAAALREQADRLAARYLSGAAAAGVSRTRAMEAATQGRFHDAITGLRQACKEFTDAARPVEAAQTLSQLADVYEWLGDYDRALSTWQQAQELVAERLEQGAPSHEDVAEAILTQLNRIAAGEPVEGTPAEDALGLRRLYYETLQGRARVNRRIGALDAARSQFEEARPFVEELVPGGADYHLAAIALDSGDVEGASEVLERIAPLFDGGLMRPRRGALRQLQSDAAQEQGNFERALTLATEGLADQDTYPDLDLSWKLHWRLARALSALGRHEEATATYRRAAAAADTLRLAPLGYQLDTSFVRDKLPMLHEAMDHALAVEDEVAVLEIVEYLKARGLAAVLSTPSVPRAADGQESEFDALSATIDALAFASYSGAATVADLRRRAELLERRRALLEEIRVKDPRWRGLRVPSPPDVAGVHRTMQVSRRLALVLHLRRDRVVAGLLGLSTGIVVGSRTWDETTFDAVRHYAENLTKVQPDHFMNDLSDEGGVDLTQLLPMTVADALTAALDSVSALLVVPHHILHLLPWAALTLNDRRLYEAVSVGVLPNLATLAITDELGSPSPRAALVGDPDYSDLSRYPPLPEASAELTDLEHLYGTEGLIASTARGRDATQDAVLALLTRPEAGAAILHLACHADVAADEPLASGLILTASTLDAGEVIQSRCAFPEVVLSACSTGWRPHSTHGLELAGDDALGLVASFLEAGARSLLVSVSKANDQVARTFMVAWHQHRHAGSSPLQAFRAAQLQLSDEGVPVWAWAGITAYGSR